MKDCKKIKLSQEGTMKRGFTLMELLVVVIIIGILVAIAMPQYMKTVERSRASEALTNLQAMGDATNRYYLRNGDYGGIDISAGNSNLDIDVTADASGKFSYFISGTAAATNAWVPADPGTTIGDKGNIAAGSNGIAIFAMRSNAGVAATNPQQAYTFALVNVSGALAARYCRDSSNNPSPGALCNGLTGIDTTTKCVGTFSTCKLK